VGLSSHLRVRLALSFLGVLGGGLLNLQLARAGSFGDGHLALFFAPPLLGALLLPAIFSYLRAAACPRCGGPARPRHTRPVFYACGTCGKESNAMDEWIQRQMAAMHSPAAARTDALLAGLCLLAGLVLIGGAAWLARDRLPIALTGVSTNGSVTRVHHPRLVEVEYQAGPTTFTLEHRSLSQRAYRLGETVPVRYLSDDPIRAEVVHSVGELLAAPAILAVVGMACTVFGLLVRQRHLRAGASV
jgi:hypothetical protein